jgi:hypothetical protein
VQIIINERVRLLGGEGEVARKLRSAHPLRAVEAEMLQRRLTGLFGGLAEVHRTGVHTRWSSSLQAVRLKPHANKLLSQAFRRFLTGTASLSSFTANPDDTIQESSSSEHNRASTTFITSIRHNAASGPAAAFKKQVSSVAFSELNVWSILNMTFSNARIFSLVSLRSECPHSGAFRRVECAFLNEAFVSNFSHSATKRIHLMHEL